MSEASKPFYTIKEYLAHEEKANRKSEYYNGEIFLMAGSSHSHNLITSNINGELTQSFKQRNCWNYATEMKLFVESYDFYTYPDIMALCGEPDFVAGRDDVITNPSIIMEVLSKSTRSYDMTTKFQFYQALATLQHYVLVKQREVKVIHYQKQVDNVWLMQTLTNLSDVLALSAIDVTITLSDIYNKVQFKELKKRIIRHPEIDE